MDLIKLIKDVLFPKYCLECGQEGEWLCQKCLKILRLVIKPQFFCPHCYKDNFSGRACPPSLPVPQNRSEAEAERRTERRACPDCRPHTFLDRALSVGQYEEKLMSKLVKLFKYNFVEETGPILNCLIQDFARQNLTLFSSPMEEYLIVPVPLHRRRYAWRGFNQAEILSRFWSKSLGLDVDRRLLFRCRHTKTQVKLSGDGRRKNLVGAFTVKKPLSRSRIILVDDVFTTGSTLQECARVLKSAGAQEVWGLTLARER